MSDWPEVQVCFIEPCGTVTLPVADGTVTCRTCAGNLHYAETGLLDEMRRSDEGACEPTPWRSAAQRDAAIEAITGRQDLTEDTRRRLVAHVQRTPWYEDA